MVPLLPDRLPLLITGIAGVAGLAAFNFFHGRYPGQVIGMRPRQTWQLVGPGIVSQEAEDAAGVASLFRTHRFGSVLNCIGNCALKSCELDPDMARTINVRTAETLVANVIAHRSRLVHLSSDLVFSGLRPGNYLETDAVDPVTIYGMTMAEAEALIASSVPAAAILRISLPMGPSFNRHAGAIDWIQSRFRKNRPATLYFDEVRSCTYCDDLNRVFAWFLDNNAAGLFHLGGPRAMTLYQIAQVVNRIGGYDPFLLKGCPRLDAGPVPPRAGNVSMCSDKLISAMGHNPFRPWPCGDDLLPTDRHWHFQRTPHEGNGVAKIATRLYQYPTAGV